MQNTNLTIYNFKNEYHWLSNMYTHSAIIIDGITYNSVEAYYQANKSTNLGTRHQISKRSPYEAKTLGSNLKLRPDWKDVKNDVMREGLNHKFSLPQFKNLLVNTGTKQLIHGVHHNDEYWGWCFKTQQGKNILGVMINEIRTELYEELENREYTINELPTLKRILSLFKSDHDKAVVLWLQNKFIEKKALYKEVEGEAEALTSEQIETILSGKADLVPLSSTLKEILTTYQAFLDKNATVTIY